MACSSSEDHPYRSWAEQFWWNDRRCDYCERLLPNGEVVRHNVRDRKTGAKIPTTVYCSEQCYKLNREAGNIGIETDLGVRL